MIAGTVFLFSVVLIAADAQYIHSFKQPFNFECPANQHLRYIVSVHSNGFEDRVWGFQCRQSGRTVQCVDSDYINEFDQIMNFNCSGAKVMTGIAGEFDGFYKDRKFKVECCNIQRKTPKNCVLSDFVNDWDKPLTFSVPPGQVIKGVYSEHNNFFEDRRWKFLTCTL